MTTQNEGKAHKWDEIRKLARSINKPEKAFIQVVRNRTREFLKEISEEEFLEIFGGEE